MIEMRRLLRLAPTTMLATAAILAGCLNRRHGPGPSPAAQPTVVAVEPATQAPPLSVTPLATEAPEPRINLRMVDAPVRLVLQKLAELGNLDLIIPGNINRTLSVLYVNTPVSVALEDALSRSGLRLGSGPRGNLPFDTVTVFYQLPANVDSMSVDGLMRRYGVSRAIAELIVKSRRP
jgi:hypothetical protein